MLRKSIISCLVILFTLTSCKKENEAPIDGFLINASIDASANGKTARLIKFANRTKTVLDSATIQNGSLSIEGKVDAPDMYFLEIEGNNNNLPMIVENSTIDIELNVDSLHTSKVSGGKENDALSEYQNLITPLRVVNNRLSSEFRTAQASRDTAAVNRVRKKYDSVMKTGNAIDLKFVNDNKDVVVSALILERMYLSKVIDAREGLDLYNQFSDDLKNSRPSIDTKKLMDANLATAIGSIAPNFSAPTPDGNTISLNDIKGKITIIDFWAAWCGPCRRENPNIVEVYEKYHDKGLEIIGVSLDGNRRQNEPEKAWKDAIEKDKLAWHQVSNLSYFNGPIAKQYNINSIPAMFILDEEGKIIAKNLRGPALEQKIAELLD